jgi:hypothetical protein
VSRPKLRAVKRFSVTRQEINTNWQLSISLNPVGPVRPVRWCLWGCIAREVALEAFGHIEVHHADIFSFWEQDTAADHTWPYRGQWCTFWDMLWAVQPQELTKHLEDLHLAETPETVGRAMILPMAPNLLPYRSSTTTFSHGWPCFPNVFVLFCGLLVCQCLVLQWLTWVCIFWVGSKF